MWQGEFWAQHWWLIIVMACFVGPILGVLLRPFSDFFAYQRRRDAMEVLKVYAQQGKEPPPEVLDAVRGYRGWGYRGGGWSSSGASTRANSALNDTSGVVSDRAQQRADRRQARMEQRWDRWEQRRPWSRWNGAIFMTALAAEFGVASQYANENSQNVFLLVAIIAGAMAVAAIISALLGTFMKVD